MKIQAILDIEIEDFPHTEEEMNAIMRDLLQPLGENVMHTFILLSSKKPLKVTGDWYYKEADEDLFNETEDFTKNPLNPPAVKHGTASIEILKKRSWGNEYKIVSSVNSETTWHDAEEEINELLNDGWFCWGGPSVVGTEFIQGMMRMSELKEQSFKKAKS